MLKRPVIPAIPPPAGERLTGLSPVVSDHTALLILGSFPGTASLAAQQYYGHPQNHFWRILQAIWPSSQRQMVMDSYENRIQWLLDHGLGLWDVYASCERRGSLDTAIRHAQVNDFASLKARCPALRATRRCWGSRCIACRPPVRPTPPGASSASSPPGATSFSNTD
jgi:hypoxanthine-DNA glycosylase